MRTGLLLRVNLARPGPASLLDVSRYRGRFGLPALTTPDAFVAWIVLSVAAVLVLVGVGEVFNVGIPSFAVQLAVWLPLLLVVLTPKQRSRDKR